MDGRSNLNFPIWGLMGEPSGCNSYGNGFRTLNKVNTVF